MKKIIRPGAKSTSRKRQKLLTKNSKLCRSVQELIPQNSNLRHKNLKNFKIYNNSKERIDKEATEISEKLYSDALKRKHKEVQPKLKKKKKPKINNESNKLLLKRFMDDFHN